MKTLILRRDHYHCQMCGVRTISLEVDHKVPRAKGGTNNPLNLWSLCRPCNQAKGVRDLILEADENL